jgi:hypothetical protein
LLEFVPKRVWHCFIAGKSDDNRSESSDFVGATQPLISAQEEAVGGFARSGMVCRSIEKLYCLSRAIAGVCDFTEAQSGRGGVGVAIPNVAIMRFGFVEATEIEQGIGEEEASGGGGGSKITTRIRIGKEEDGAIEVRDGSHRIIYELRKGEIVQPARFVRVEGGCLYETLACFGANFVSQQHHAETAACLSGTR